MENIGNINNYEDVMSQDSSDESVYFSASDSPVLPPYEEFDNRSYLSESENSSIYSEIYEPVIGQVSPTTVNYIEVLGIFPVEVRGTTFYQPQFYYLPVYNNVYYTFSPDFAQEGYDTESTEYCSTNSYTDISSSSSDTYYTAEESQLYFDEYEETNVGTTSVEFYLNEDFDSSKGSNEYVASESLEGNEEEGCDNVELQNEIQYTSSDDEYDYGAEEFGYFNEINVETTSFEFSPNDDFDLRKGNEYVASESSKSNEEEVCDNVELQNEIKYTSGDDIQNNKVEIPRPFYDGDSNNRSDSSEKSSINAFKLESINYKDCQNQGLKKYKSFDDLSGKTQRQPLKKQDGFKNLLILEDDEVHEKDFQRNNTEISMVSHEQNEKNLASPPDDFELTEEEVKYLKDEIYRRALSGKLYQKTHIPSVDVLPTILEENESFSEIDEQADSLPLCLTEADSQSSCFIEADSPPSCLTEHQGLLNGSLCNLFEPSEENGEDSKKSQQKPKKKKMKRLREFMARIFCCVKPP